MKSGQKSSDFRFSPSSPKKTASFDDVPRGTFQVGGKKITSKDQFKHMAKVMQEFIAKNYNPLDLNTPVKYPKTN